MSWLTDPFTASFLVRALVGGVLVAVVCGVAGTWVVIRGSAFLGEALAHGMLPGVAIAALIGVPAVLGAAVSAAVMATGIGLLSRRRLLSDDTAIGLVFVGMLALGVLIVSRSRSFATDLTAILFGDILAVDGADLAWLAVAALLVVVLAAAFHRPFVALSFDPVVAQTLGQRPRLAAVALTTLVTLAVVSSYSAVGTLLVVALLVAPAAAARPWTGSIVATMALAALLGGAATALGLLLSWHAGTAAGASIALTAVAIFLGSAVLRSVRRPPRAAGAPAPAPRPGEPITGR